LVGQRTVDGGRWTVDDGFRTSYGWLIVHRPLSIVLPVLAALLLALSPVYLLYARTATVVGVSLVPMLLTLLALFRALARPDLWWRTAALFGTLVLGAYGYAPIRFLWPICVGVLLLESFLRKELRPRLLLSAAFIT